MIIRQGTKKDVQKIKKYLIDSWLNHVDEEPEFLNRPIIEKSDLSSYFEDCFNGSKLSYFFIAEENSKIAGFLKVNIQELQPFFNETKVLYLDDGYVFEEYRGKGISKLLNQEAETLAKKLGIKWLKARVYQFNKSAQSALEKQGFKNLYSEWFKVINTSN